LLRTFLAALALLPLSALAREGMWLPPNLKAREAEMRKMGLRIPVDSLYNTAGTGLNAAVVQFGGGCTGEIISPRGLLLTNHHCGYGTVQRLATRGADYFAAGFWAPNEAGELPCPGLTVTFVRRMENVTAGVLTGIDDTLRGAARDTLIARRVRSLESHYRRGAPGMEAAIKPYYGGNQYWVQVTETFRDVRLVGFPPNGIGQFGGDTDNWMWPRHTGDFSLFRVYAAPDGKPADYAKANVPARTPRFFTINAGGYKEGDFTMVYGFPGQTQEYLTAPQLGQTQNIIDPARVAIRTAKLDVWTARMAADRDVFLKYTSKRAGVANAWKKWQGELRGLRLNDVQGIKREEEDVFTAWAARDTSLPWADDLLPRITALAATADTALRVETYLQEAVLGVEAVAQGPALERLLAAARSGRGDSANKVAAALWTPFFKNYDAPTDKATFAALMPMFVEANPGFVPAAWRDALRRYDGSYERWADAIWSNSLATDSARMYRAIEAGPATLSERLSADPALALYRAVQALRRERLAPTLARFQTDMPALNRQYIRALMASQPSRDFYPDANFTLRLAYGQVRGIDPDGPATYSYQTTLDEAIAKDNPEVEEFRVPEKLKALHAAKDFGRWKKNGSVPIAFIADNHTTGGNSGSPVLNARGELIGTNFDRIWEGTMSDLFFDPRFSRNISLDVRYTLFVIEKFGNAGWLLKEMRIRR